MDDMALDLHTAIVDYLAQWDAIPPELVANESPELRDLARRTMATLDAALDGFLALMAYWDVDAPAAPETVH